MQQRGWGTSRKCPGCWGRAEVPPRRAVRALLSPVGSGRKIRPSPKRVRANTCVSASSTNAEIPPFCQELLALFYQREPPGFPRRSSLAPRKPAGQGRASYRHPCMAYKALGLPWPLNFTLISCRSHRRQAARFIAMHWQRGGIMR